MASTAATMARPEVAAASKSIKFGAGWRTTWLDNMALGNGFHREISTIAPSAVSFKPLDKDNQPELVCQQIHGYQKLLTSSSDFTEVFTAGGGVSMEGYGASGSATMSATTSMRLSSNTLTALVSMRYMSEPMLFINPSNSEQEVTLSAPAKELLEDVNGGPEAFHARYGSHYIAGYCKGGWLLGTYDMQFSSAQAALDASASVELEFESGLGFSGGANANFSTSVAQNNEFKSAFGQYSCSGWAKEHPPKLICSFEDLAAAHDAFNAQEGVKLEAVLRSYRDIPQYAESRTTHYKNVAASTSKPASDNFEEVSIEPNSYGIIVHVLNSEYARLTYLYEYFKDSSDPKLVDISNEARAAMRQFRKLLTLNAGSVSTIGTIRTVLKNLETYLVVYEGETPGTDASESDIAQFNAGLTWLNTYFCADDLDAKANKILPTPKPNTTPVIKNSQWDLGQSWAITTTDGHLRFYYKDTQMFVMHNTSVDSKGKLWSQEFNYFRDTLVKHDDPITLRSDKDGNRLMNNEDFNPGTALDKYKLQRPATWSNKDRDAWQKIFIEKL